MKARSPCGGGGRPFIWTPRRRVFRNWSAMHRHRKSNVDDPRHMWSNGVDRLVRQILGMARNGQQVNVDPLWPGRRIRRRLPDCRYRAIDLANCIRGCGHHKPDPVRSSVDLVFLQRILCNMLSIHGSPDRRRRRIRSPALIMPLDHAHVRRNQQPNYNCNDCERRLFHQTAAHSHKFQALKFH